MNTFLIWAGVSAFLFVATFVFFVAIMSMRTLQGKIFALHWSVRWVCFLILFIGLILDTSLNWILLTITFYEFPREFLSTTRVVRHKYQSGGFRQKQALWWCANFLTPFDAAHCDK